jgi:type VI secretion system secreted protein VgrG
MKKTKALSTSTKLARLTAILPFVAVMSVSTSTAAATWLGSAEQFAVLGGTMVTNAGPTMINGDIGVAPGASITGLGSITLFGSTHQSDPLAKRAEADAATAFNRLAGLTSTVNLSGRDLGAVGVLTPGVYTFDSAAQLTGTLVLDFADDPNGTFVFQIGSALTTASASDVVAMNGGSNSGIYWVVGSSATLGAGTAFAGNLLARQSVTLNSGATVLCGMVDAIAAAVSMDSNAISNNCLYSGALGSGRTDFGSHGFSGRSAPEPSTWAMMVMGVGMTGARLRHRRASVAAA